MEPVWINTHIGAWEHRRLMGWEGRMVPPEGYQESGQWGCRHIGRTSLMEICFQGECFLPDSGAESLGMKRPAGGYCTYLYAWGDEDIQMSGHMAPLENHWSFRQGLYNKICEGKKQEAMKMVAACLFIPSYQGLGGWLNRRAAKKMWILGRAGKERVGAWLWLKTKEFWNGLSTRYHKEK